MKRFLFILLFLLVAAEGFGAWLPGYSSRAEIDIDGTTTSDTITPEIELYYRHGKIVENGVFEWYMSTAIRHVNTHDRVYMTYITNEGDMCVRYFDETTKVLSDEQVVFSDWSYDPTGTDPGDDHGCGTTHVIQNGVHAGKFLVVASEHGANSAKGGRLYSRRSSNVEDITSWETAVEIESTLSTYVQVFENSSGTIYAFTRYTYSNDYTQARQVYYTSTDGGSTWSSRTLFANLGSGPTYLMTAVEGNTIHFLLSHADSTTLPDAYRYKDIYYAKSTDGMSTFEKADGTAITLPITTTNGDLVHTTTGTHWEFLWDITTDSSGNPHLISLDSATVGDTNNDVSVFHHYYDSGWTTDTVMSTASKKVGTYDFYCGAVFEDGNPDKVYVSAGDGASGKGMMQIYEKDGTWSKTSDISTDSPGDSFRPMSVHNFKSDGLFQMLWCYTERYTNWEPGDWDSSLFAYPGYNTGTFGSLKENSRTDFGDVRFTDSDGQTLLGVDGKGYQESKVDSWKSTWIIKTDTPQDGYLYYGNATSTYPADDTSEYEGADGYDRFPGTSLDLTKWDVESTYAAPDVASNQATYSNGDYTTTNPGVFANGGAIEFYYQPGSNTSNYILFLKADANNRLQVIYGSDEISMKSTIGGVDQTQTVVSSSIPFLFWTSPKLIRIERVSTTETKLYVDGVLEGTYTETNTSSDYGVGFLNIATGDNIYSDLRIQDSIKPSDYTFDFLNIESGPTVTITTPTTDPTYNSDLFTITIGGTSSIASGTVDSIAYSNSLGGSGACTGTATWTCTDVELDNGDNVITITGTSDVDVEGTDIITVTTAATSIKVVGGSWTYGGEDYQSGQEVGASTGTNEITVTGGGGGVIRSAIQ